MPLNGFLSTQYKQTIQKKEPKAKVSNFPLSLIFIIILFQDTAVSLLIGFIEQAENNAMMVAQQHGVNALRDNPDSMGTR